MSLRGGGCQALAARANTLLPVCTPGPFNRAEADIDFPFDASAPISQPS